MQRGLTALIVAATRRRTWGCKTSPEQTSKMTLAKVVSAKMNAVTTTPAVLPYHRV